MTVDCFVTQTYNLHAVTVIVCCCLFLSLCSLCLYTGNTGYPSNQRFTCQRRNYFFFFALSLCIWSSLSLSPSLCRPHSPSLYFSIYASLCITLYLHVSLCVCGYLCLDLSLCISNSVSICASPLSHSLYASLSFSVSLSVSLCFTLSLSVPSVSFICMSTCMSVCLSECLSLFALPLYTWSERIIWTTYNSTSHHNLQISRLPCANLKYC